MVQRAGRRIARMGIAALVAGAVLIGGCDEMDAMFRDDGSGSGYQASGNQPIEQPRPESGFGGTSTPGAGGSSTRGMRVDVGDRNVYVVRMLPGANWRSGVATADQAGYDRHLDTLRRWSAQGIVVLGGPLVSDQGTLIVIRAASLEDARELAQSDPAVTSGLFTADVDQMAAEFPVRN